MVRVEFNSPPEFKLGETTAEEAGVGLEIAISGLGRLRQNQIPPKSTKTRRPRSAKTFLFPKIEVLVGTEIPPEAGKFLTGGKGGFFGKIGEGKGRGNPTFVSGVFCSGLERRIFSGPGRKAVLFSASPSFTPTGGVGGMIGGLREVDDGCGFVISVEKAGGLTSVPLGDWPVCADFISLSIVLIEERGRTPPGKLPELTIG